ncbi:GntR family transcriptional regulator [Cobetia marina]
MPSSSIEPTGDDATSLTHTADLPVTGLKGRLLNHLEAAPLHASQRLPSEREMIERFGTTRVTLRDALLQLEAEGRIYRENRRGWFVSPPRLRYDLLACLPFHEMVQSQQRVASTEVLSAQEVPADEVIAQRLGIARVPGSIASRECGASMAGGCCTSVITCDATASRAFSISISRRIL